VKKEPLPKKEDIKSSLLDKFRQDKLAATNLEKAERIAELSDDDEFY
jgi:hypothetical protein